jgi:hypothetical protein
MESIKKGSSLIWRGKGRGRERPMATGARRRADSGLTAETGYKMISFLTDQRKEATTRSWLLAFLGVMAYRWFCFGFFTRARRRALWERPSV